MDAAVARPGGVCAAELQLLHSAFSHGASAGHPLPCLGAGTSSRRHAIGALRWDQEERLRSKRWNLIASVIADSCDEAFVFLLEFSGIAELCPQGKK